MNTVGNLFREDAFISKSVLVTGGTSGIGLAVARGFSSLGADVLAVGSSTIKISGLRKEQAEEDTQGSIAYELLDVTDSEAVSHFMKQLSGLDVVVNAAGISRPRDEYAAGDFEHVIDVNLMSVMRVSMAAIPLLKKSCGCILNIASMLSYLADANVPAYCASKSGILGITRALAHEYGGVPIRVNALAPGYHRTAMTRDLWTDTASAERICSRTALKRWGEADDVIGVALFLASDAAAYVTGECLAIDGGYVSG